MIWASCDEEGHGRIEVNWGGAALDPCLQHGMQDIHDVVQQLLQAAFHSAAPLWTPYISTVSTIVAEK